MNNSHVPFSFMSSIDYSFQHITIFMEVPEKENFIYHYFTKGHHVILLSNFFIRFNELQFSLKYGRPLIITRRYNNDH